MSDTASAGQALTQSLRAALAAHRDAVLQAPPGAGKSTLVPLALLEEPWLRGRRILLLEPRRVAARAIARRMAWLRGEPVGATVGYRMRLDTCVSRATRIEVITEGVLARMLHSDPGLDGVGCVIFDEFHQRSLQADLGLALCLDARRVLEADFRLLVMSATLEGARVATLLGGAPVVEVQGRPFPVALHYVGAGAPLLPGGRESPERLVAQTVRRVLDETRGDLLVFLPGAGEIMRVQTQLADLADARLQLLPLYGELEARQQDSALSESATGLRRVVLATNIAETSVTIPGVTVVIDAGLARRSRFDPVTGMSRLEVLRISRAAADQRAGRAGRTAPGRCYRLWSEGSHATLAPFTPPEITEADLAPLALELALWGSADAARLAWLDAPPAPMLAQARELLQRLDALDARGAITPLGREMAAFPLHPRLAHMALAARGHGAVPLAAELAALLSERDLLRGGGAQRDPDIRTRLEMLRGDPGALSAERAARQRVQRNAAQIQQLASGPQRAAVAPPSPVSPGMLLALAFPDRIARRRAEGSGRYLLANGRGAAFPAATGLGAQEFIVAVELDDRAREARIDLAAPLERRELEQLFGAQFITSEEVEWDARSAAVLAHRTTPLRIAPDRRSPAAGGAAGAGGRGHAGGGSASWGWPHCRGMRRRATCSHDWNLCASWSAHRTDPGRRATTRPCCTSSNTGCRRGSRACHAAIISRDLPLAEALLARLEGSQRRALDELAPRDIAVPSGSRIRIDYVDDNAPAIAVRLQEVFGLAAHAANRRWHSTHYFQAALAGAASGADHARPGRLLENELPRGPQGHARPLSQAQLAGRSAFSAANSRRTPTQVIMARRSLAAASRGVIFAP